MHTAHSWLASCFVVLGLQSVLAAAEPIDGMAALSEEGVHRRSVSPEYRILLQRYASGDPAAAVDEFLSWTQPRIEQEMKTLRALGAEARLCGPIPSADGRKACGPSPSWATAALMLHTDAAARDQDAGRSPIPQRAAALAVALLVKNDTALSPFLRRWYVAVAAQAQSRTAYLDALEWADRGLKEFPDATDLRLVIASVEEVLAGLVDVRLPDAVFDDPDGDALRLSLLRNDKRRHAPRARPTRAPPGPRDRTGPHCRATPTGPRGLAPWFGGTRPRRPCGRSSPPHHRVRKCTSRTSSWAASLKKTAQLDEAVKAYSEAVSLDPQCQAARLALSHAYMKRGESASARRWLNLAVSSAGRRATQDAFWTYPWGLSARSETLLASLRREVAP